MYLARSGTKGRIACGRKPSWDRAETTVEAATNGPTKTKYGTSMVETHEFGDVVNNNGTKRQRPK